MYKYDESKLSIIQIAIEDNIYIFDMKSLDYSMYLDDTLKNIFSNTKILSQENKKLLEKELDTMYYSNSSLFLEHKYIRSVVMKFLPGLI